MQNHAIAPKKKHLPKKVLKLKKSDFEKKIKN